MVERIVLERPMLEATPRVCLHDVHTSIRVRGLPPNRKITIKAALSDQKGVPFCSNAHYVTNDTGEVDLDTAESMGGSYTGVFPAGLLTSLMPAPGQFPYHRLVAKDTSKPWKIKLSVHFGHEALHDWSLPEYNLEMERHTVAPGVRRIPIRIKRVRGVLYIPAGHGPFPCVIDLFGGVGGCVEHRSAMLASRGIMSLALAYFKYEDLPQSYNNLDVEYFQEAVDYLTSLPEALKGNCGVIGTCLGGLFAIVMAIYCKQVRCIITINTASIASSSIVTHKGIPIIEGISVSSTHMEFDSEMRVMPVKDIWNEYIRFDHPNLLPVQNIPSDKSVLFVGGDGDSMLGHKSALAMESAMKHCGKTNVSSLIYPGAGHMIEPPYGPLIDSSYQVSSKPVGKDPPNYVMYWGGGAKGTCKAQVELWQVVQDFIKSNLNMDTYLKSTENDEIYKSKL